MIYDSTFSSMDRALNKIQPQFSLEPCWSQLTEMMNQRNSKGQLSLSPDLPKMIAWSYKLKKQDKAKAKGKNSSRLPKGPPPGRPGSNEEILALERDRKAF